MSSAYSEGWRSREDLSQPRWIGGAGRRAQFVVALAEGEGEVSPSSFGSVTSNGTSIACQMRDVNQ